MKSEWSVRGGLIPLPVFFLSLTLLQAQEWVGMQPRVIPWSRSGVADRVRLGVRTEGLHTVSADEVAVAMNLPAAVVSNAFQTTNILLTCQGQTVPCSLADGGLCFKGESARTNRVPENVYWLQVYAGMSSPPPSPSFSPTNDWTMETTTRQGNMSVSYPSMGTLTNLPSFLAFSLITYGKSYTVTNVWSDGVTNPAPGALSVTLLSAASGESAPDQHAARISLNGTVLGSPSWENESCQTFTYAVPGELLTNGVAVLRVENMIASGSNARFFWTAFALTTARRTDRIQPMHRPSVRGVSDADGFAADNRADYVVLLPPEGWVTGFRETLQPLVDFRRRQGLQVAVMDVEALYNRFSYGLAKPEAIRSFCQNAYQSPDVKLRYLLLAGSGSLDYAHEKATVTNYNPCLIPPLLESQRFPESPSKEAMLVAVDQAFGDVTGTAAPEIAVGRFPASRTQELAVAVAKTLGYEATPPWKATIACSASSGFTNDMNTVRTAFQSTGKNTAVYLPAKQTTWNTALKPAFREGVGIFVYLGHSNTQTMGDTPSLLTNTQVKELTSSNTPIALLMGCLLNSWQNMIASEDAACFGTCSLFYPASGFAAVFASTGYAWDGAFGPLGEAQRLALYLGDYSSAAGIFRLGDALCAAEQKLALYDPEVNSMLPNVDPQPIARERLLSYSLIGDPAMMWRHDFTGTGTPVAWLQDHGLTAWDGDVSDLDNDGWNAWQEYQAGTRPDTNRFQIASQTLVGTQGTLGLRVETVANKNYRVVWKYALDDETPWTPTAWSLPGELQTLRSPDEFIRPSSALMTICVPMRPGEKQGFFRLQQE